MYFYHLDRFYHFYQTHITYGLDTVRQESGEWWAGQHLGWGKIYFWTRVSGSMVTSRKDQRESSGGSLVASPNHTLIPVFILTQVPATNVANAGWSWPKSSRPLFCSTWLDLTPPPAEINESYSGVRPRPPNTAWKDKRAAKAAHSSNNAGFKVCKESTFWLRVEVEVSEF